MNDFTYLDNPIYFTSTDGLFRIDGRECTPTSFVYVCLRAPFRESSETMRIDVGDFNRGVGSGVFSIVRP